LTEGCTHISREAQHPCEDAKDGLDSEADSILLQQKDDEDTLIAAVSGVCWVQELTEMDCA